MVEFSSRINNRIGMHLRAAGEFVKVASRFKSEITVFNGGRQANGKSILGLAGLAIPADVLFTIQIDGKDEKDARKAIEELIASNFNEDSSVDFKDRSEK
ncbi:MAG: HPr family phosphocarrier protein [Candidatus Latescibacteria bacterium]|nr:HPr family phosphocarrier protein [Candidatus Latescibacterota bacterium]NIO78302.1 HPr family phosphocarrier protein [Candidatus Latescibacterota bacterium]